MKILITGGSGKLGRELAKIYLASLRPTRSELDIINSGHVDLFVSENKPNLVIHTAAVTNVQHCEENKREAYETNVVGTENLVDACFRFNPKCYFVHASTACVFRGDLGNYTETDLEYPKNYYALTKLLSEYAVKYSGLKHLIVRTNFVSRAKWPYPCAFVDRFGTYLFASDVAAAIKHVIDKKLTGTVHVRGDEKMSMFELAKITTPSVKPMSLTEYSGVPLTIDMSLSSNRLPPFKISR